LETIRKRGKSQGDHKRGPGFRKIGAKDRWGVGRSGEKKLKWSRATYEKKPTQEGKKSGLREKKQEGSE